MALIPLGLIVQTQANYKRMTPEQYGALRASVAAFGWKSFAVVRPLDDGTYEMIDGHHRLKLAEERGLDELPCVILDENVEKAGLARFSFNVAGEVLPEVYLDAMRALQEEFGTDDTAAFTGLSQNFVAGVIAQANADADAVLGSAPVPTPAAPPAVKPAKVVLPKSLQEKLTAVRNLTGAKSDEEAIERALDMILAGY